MNTLHLMESPMIEALEPQPDPQGVILDTLQAIGAEYLEFDDCDGATLAEALAKLPATCRWSG